MPSTTSIAQASSWSAVRLSRRNRPTEAIEARASPRKPMVPIASRSAAGTTLLVAWEVTASGRSSGSMPRRRPRRG